MRDLDGVGAATPRGRSQDSLTIDYADIFEGYPRTELAES